MADEGGKDGSFGDVPVMVVEDEPMTMELMGKLLEGLGVGGIVKADNAGQALDRVGESGAGIDLIITDIEMPEMDGFELIRRIRYGVVPEKRHVPVLVLTGKDTEKNIRKAQIHKISGFIVKPPARNVIERMMREALGR